MDFLVVVSFLPVGGMSRVMIGLYAWCDARGLLAMKDFLRTRNEKRSPFFEGCGGGREQIKFGHGTLI